MNLKYILPFLTFGLIGSNLQAQDIPDSAAIKDPNTIQRFIDDALAREKKQQEKKSKKPFKKDEAVLLPIEWNGEVKPYNSNFWVGEGKTLTSIPEIYGKASARMPAVFYDNPKDTVKGYLIQIPLKKALEMYKESNKNLTDTTSAKLWDSTFIPLEVKDSLFYNGLHGTEKEFDKLKEGAYGCLHVVDSKKGKGFGASGYGIFVVNREKEIPDTTKKERDTLEAKTSFGFGAGYFKDNPNSFNANISLEVYNWIFRVGYGFGENSSETPEVIRVNPRNPVTGWLGESSEKFFEKNTTKYLEGEFGYNFGDVSLVFLARYQDKDLTKTRHARVINRDEHNNIIESKSRDYPTVKDENGFGFGTGVDVNVSNLSFSPRIVYDGKNIDIGGKIFYKIKLK